MQRALKTTRMVVERTALPDTLTDEAALRAYLAEQAKAQGLSLLLAHCDDGVIWGKLAGDTLHLSGDYFRDVSPPLRPQTVLHARLFGPTGELYLWRDGENRLTARRASEQADPAGTAPTSGDGTVLTEYYEEDVFLWGDSRVREDGGFVLFREGAQGLCHAVPADGAASKPPQLIVRHYLAPTSDARVAFSRLVGLKPVPPSPPSDSPTPKETP